MWVGGTGVFTGVTMRLAGETRTGVRLAAALTPGWCRVHGGTVTWPRPLEHKAHQSEQHHLGEKETGDSGTTPSDRWRHEGILLGFQTVGIRRTLEVHDPEHHQRPVGTVGWHCRLGPKDKPGDHSVSASATLGTVTAVSAPVTFNV